MYELTGKYVFITETYICCITTKKYRIRNQKYSHSVGKQHLQQHKILQRDMSSVLVLTSHQNMLKTIKAHVWRTLWWEGVWTDVCDLTNIRFVVSLQLFFKSMSWTRTSHVVHYLDISTSQKDHDLVTLKFLGHRFYKYV